MFLYIAMLVLFVYAKSNLVISFYYMGGLVLSSWQGYQTKL